MEKSPKFDHQGGKSPKFDHQENKSPTFYQSLTIGIYFDVMHDKLNRYD